jgi:hypothetical protein
VLGINIEQQFSWDKTACDRPVENYRATLSCRIKDQGRSRAFGLWHFVRIEEGVED